MERIGQHKYAGKTTSSNVDEPKESCCGKCKTKDLCVWLFICLLLALVVAAIVLVVMVIVGVVPVCNCAACKCFSVYHSVCCTVIDQL